MFDETTTLADLEESIKAAVCLTITPNATIKAYCEPFDQTGMLEDGFHLMGDHIP